MWTCTIIFVSFFSNLLVFLVQESHYVHINLYKLPYFPYAKRCEKYVTCPSLKLGLPTDLQSLKPIFLFLLWLIVYYIPHEPDGNMYSVSFILKVCFLIIYTEPLNTWLQIQTNNSHRLGPNWALLLPDTMVSTAIEKYQVL